MQSAANHERKVQTSEATKQMQHYSDVSWTAVIISNSGVAGLIFFLFYMVLFKV